MGFVDILKCKFVYLHFSFTVDCTETVSITLIKSESSLVLLRGRTRLIYQRVWMLLPNISLKHLLDFRLALPARTTRALLILSHAHAETYWTTCFRSEARWSLSGVCEHAQSLWKRMNPHDSAAGKRPRSARRSDIRRNSAALWDECWHFAATRVGSEWEWGFFPSWKPCCGAWVDVRFATPFPVSVAQNRRANIRGARTNPLH